MATIKAFTDINQSRELAKILPLESADMWFANGAVVARHSVDEPDNIKSVMPCWSLAALIDVFPTIQDNKPAIFLNDNSIIYPYISGLSVKADNPTDACYEMILKLHDNNLL